MLCLDDNEGSSSDTAPLFQMAGDGKNTDDITIPMLFLFNKEGNIILDAIQEYEAVEVLLSDKAKDRGKVRGDLCNSSSHLCRGTMENGQEWFALLPRGAVAFCLTLELVFY